jgi:Fe-S cluster biogenesis protein NfuA
MIANVKNIFKQARPDLQVGGGDVNLVNVNNRIAALKLKAVHGAARRRNHV